MKTRMSSKGQIVLPAEVRKQDHIEVGEEFDIQRVGEDPPAIRDWTWTRGRARA